MGRAPSTVTARVHTVDHGTSRRRDDRLAVEEPLEIRVSGNGGGGRTTAAVTMRTPGNDFELAAGLLFAEGLLAGRDDLRTIRYCRDGELDGPQEFNIVTVEVAGATPATANERHFSATSACGLCGRATVDLLAERVVPRSRPGHPVLTPALIVGLPEALATGQQRQAETGAVHAAGLFDAGGSLLCVREDVGRHNAVDKVVGWALLEGCLPLTDHLMAVSGRASFEIVQKAAVAGIPVVCAVSGPSSLAVDTAQRFGMTLAGFVRGERFNLYAGEERLQAG